MTVNEKGVLPDSRIYFYTPSNLALSMFYYLQCAGEFYCNGDYMVKRNDFNSYLIMYIRKGTGNVSFDGRSYMVKENDVVLLNCHKPHIYSTSVGWETLWIHYDGSSSQQFFETLYNRIGCALSLEDSVLVPRYLKQITDSFKKGRPLPEPLISCYIQRMLTEIMLLSSGYAEKDMEKTGSVMDAVTFIEAGYRQRITLEMLADVANLSPFHFSRVFKKETGYAPYEYIIKTRINMAKGLLKNTGLAVKEIAFEVGYNSESNFVNTFHANTGFTPNEFRKMPV